MLTKKIKCQWQSQDSNASYLEKPLFPFSQRIVFTLQCYCLVADDPYRIEKEIDCG